MRGVLTVLAVVGIVTYVIARQLIGEPLRGKRLLVLPLVLAVVGVVDISKQGAHIHLDDDLLLVLSATLAVVIGVLQGLSMRLQARDGFLWGQLPRRSLWFWVALAISHGAILLAARGMGAHVAAGSAATLVVLGANRLAQGAVVTPRALRAGIPFAPESNGSSPFSGLFPPAAVPATREASRGTEANVWDGPGTRSVGDYTPDPMSSRIPGPHARPFVAGAAAPPAPVESRPRSALGSLVRGIATVSGSMDHDPDFNTMMMRGRSANNRPRRSRQTLRQQIASGSVRRL